MDEKYEAGIALYGTEVKSVRAGTVNLKDSYCEIKDGELYADSDKWMYPKDLEKYGFEPLE